MAFNTRTKETLYEQHFSLSTPQLSLSTPQEHGIPGTLSCMVNDQEHKQHPGLDGSPALQPWPRETAYTDEEEDGEGEREDEEHYGNTKLKMFEMAPLDDPDMEDRRQRAIYAKRNREMKKREMAKLQQDVVAIQKAKEHYQAELACMNDLTQRQQHKIQEQEQCLSDVRRQLRVNEQQLQSMQWKLNRMRQHMELIAKACDEDSMIGRMIINLLAMYSL